MSIDENNIVIYQAEDGRTEIDIRLENETLWLNQKQIAALFEVDRTVITRHIKNVYAEGELQEKPTSAKIAQVQKEGERTISREIDFYNLDMVIAIGYRVNSQKATAFRIWATDILRRYLVDGYALNEKRLQEKTALLERATKAISLLERSIQNQIENVQQAKKLTEVLAHFAAGLALLDDYDNKNLDVSGKTKRQAKDISTSDFLSVIQEMRPRFASELFGQPKDDSFESSVRQVYQSFGDTACYPSIEEKAAMLLYLVTKNHSFLDGNKRIAAACFLYFLNENGLLYSASGDKMIDDETLFALTLLIAESKPIEMDVMKQIIVSVLNRKEVSSSP